VVAKAVTNPAEIKENLIAQLTGAVKWTQTVQAMVAYGATHFTEVGPGKVLQGLVQKVHKEAVVDGVN
jgi:[acyl-carrier-protein] S-malonyltransferase